MTDITRLHTSERASKVVVQGGVAHLSGQVAEDPEADIQKQTRSTLGRVDGLLAEAGSDREHLLSATIYLRGIVCPDERSVERVGSGWSRTRPRLRRSTHGPLEAARRDLRHRSRQRRRALVASTRSESNRSPRRLLSGMSDQRPPFPPFDEAAAWKKVLGAAAAWNTRDVEKISLAYSTDSEWRIRDTFLEGRDDIRDFLSQKWSNELDYALRKDLSAYTRHQQHAAALTTR